MILTDHSIYKNNIRSISSSFRFTVLHFKIQDIEKSFSCCSDYKITSKKGKETPQKLLYKSLIVAVLCRV